MFGHLQWPHPPCGVDKYCVEDMAKFLLLRLPNPPHRKKNLYLRFWPLNVREGDQWNAYAPYQGGKFNDLDQVGLLAGEWFDDKKGNRALIPIVKEPEDFFLEQVGVCDDQSDNNDNDGD